MGKSIITKHTTFCLCDKHNKARLSMFLPMQYSLADILYIISEYTGYKIILVGIFITPIEKN